MSTLKDSMSHNPSKWNGTLPFKFDPCMLSFTLSQYYLQHVHAKPPQHYSKQLYNRYRESFEEYITSMVSYLLLSFRGLSFFHNGFKSIFMDDCIFPFDLKRFHLFCYFIFIFLQFYLEVRVLVENWWLTMLFKKKIDTMYIGTLLGDGILSRAMNDELLEL